MSLSQIFLLSPRGDTIIFKDFRGNVAKVPAAAPLPGATGPRSLLVAPPPVNSSHTGGRRHWPYLQTATEVFFRKAKFWDGKGTDAPPAFQVDGVQYLHVKVRAVEGESCGADDGE